jgi:hypothetical protein
MATVEQIAELRLLVAEPTEDTYTDAALGVAIDAAGGDLDLVARDIWVQKAAKFSALVDISEAGSSRSMGSLHANALKMVDLFNAKLDRTKADVVVGTRIRKLTR